MQPSKAKVMHEIESDDLALRDIPLPDASWNEILNFALTFDGYEYWGSFERCAAVAEARSPGTITGLRTCLFHEQRCWRNGDEAPPNKKTLKYWKSLVHKIRTIVIRKIETSAEANESENR
jgi:hypothetical protein